jgi:RimJ/RimL family protein N-acetyltransferase
MQTLRSERLLFHHWQTGDLDDAIALWGNPEVMAMLGGVQSREQIVARLSREIDSQAQHGYQYWKLTTLSDHGQFVGCCGLKLTDLEDGARVVEMGFHLMPQAWGRGFASEASRATLDFAFTLTDQVYAGHHPGNLASQKVLEKLRFERIGERFYAPTGLMHPWYRRCR